MLINNLFFFPKIKTVKNIKLAYTKIADAASKNLNIANGANK